MSNNSSKEISFADNMVRIGIITVCLAIVANFIPALYLWLARGIIPDFSTILSIWSLAFVTFGVGWIVQPITYYSIMGVSGSYIGWVAGSVADLRAPCATMAQKVAGVEAGTPEGDIMSTIGVTSSVFVSVTIITIFTFIGAYTIPLLPAFIKSSFAYILPAVFGAVYADMSSKNLEIGAGTIVSGLVLVYLLPKLGISKIYMTLFVIAAGMLMARGVYTMKKRKEQGN